MDRLTKRTSYGTVEPPYQLVSQSEEDDWHKEVAKKLAYYEDLEENRSLPILYIGSDIYFRVKGMNQFGEHVDFIQTQKIGRIDIDSNGILYCTASVKFIANDIGKTVFLTREEAELKLKECE